MAKVSSRIVDIPPSEPEIDDIPPSEPELDAGDPLPFPRDVSALGEVSALPMGVQMHDDAGAPPMPMRVGADDALLGELPKPPRGWQGSYLRCGGCGDFIGTADRCSKCAPSMMPSNVYNIGGQ